MVGLDTDCSTFLITSMILMQTFVQCNLLTDKKNYGNLLHITISNTWSFWILNFMPYIDSSK